MDIGTKGYISDLVDEVNSMGTEQLKRKIEEHQGKGNDEVGVYEVWKLHRVACNFTGKLLLR